MRGGRVRVAGRGWVVTGRWSTRSGLSALFAGAPIVQSLTVRLEVTRRADLALQALAEIGRTPGRIKGRRLAELCGTTPSFLTQAVAPLVKAGWVRSDPGPTGGYRLDVDLRQVSVLQVIEAVEGTTDTGRCVVADRPCDPAQPCGLHVAWQRARAELEHTLATTSLDQLTPEAH